jgi:hypothetical protein
MAAPLLVVLICVKVSDLVFAADSIPRVSAFRAGRDNVLLDGGRGGIRTHVRIAPKPDFESGAFNHSATLPAVAEMIVIPVRSANDYSGFFAAIRPCRPVPPFLAGNWLAFQDGLLHLRGGLDRCQGGDRENIETNHVCERFGL